MTTPVLSSLILFNSFSTASVPSFISSDGSNIKRIIATTNPVQKALPVSVASLFSSEHDKHVTVAPVATTEPDGTVTLSISEEVVKSEPQAMALTVNKVETVSVDKIATGEPEVKRIKVDEAVKVENQS